jgi:cyclophilin family peptidyl-prolyl cis-trans isomerase
MNTHFYCLAAVMALAISFVGCESKEEINPEAAATAEIIEPYSNKIRVETSLGEFTLELMPEAAPVTVANFQKRVRDGFYDGLVFHRVIPNFMIQGGGHSPNMSTKAFRGVIINEADIAKANGLTNKRGTISMAYVPGDPHGASVQFFINLKNNPNLDFKEKSLKGWGHCPFGKIIEGMEVIDKISKVKTTKVHNQSDVPLEPVIIAKAEEIKK